MINQSLEFFGGMNGRKQDAVRCEAVWVFFIDPGQFRDDVRSQQPAQVESALCDGTLFGVPVGGEFIARSDYLHPFHLHVL